MRGSKGFSLIELLIVVAIILIIAAIAIPNFQRSRLAANEASAVGSMHQVNTAQVTYSMAYPNIGYADDMAKLGGSGGSTAAHAMILDWVLGCAAQPCQKGGYQFSIVNAKGVPISDYQVNGVPIIIGTTGNRGFCADEGNTITVDQAGGTACTKPLQ